VPLSFDWTGFQRTDSASWSHPVTGDHVGLEYFDLVPDLPAALDDLPKLRQDLTVLAGESGCLIEAHVLDFGGEPALLRLQKLPLPNQPTGQGFVAAITVPKATCSATLQIVCTERGMTGMREATLMAQLGMENWVRPHPYAPGFTGKLPYHAGDDVQWDSQFPDHPLSRARAWIRHAIRTAQVDPRFAALPPFRPTPQQEPPVAPGTRLRTVVTGIPIGGYLPLWFDNETAMYWQMQDSAQVLTRLGSGAIGRSPLADDWRRECLLFDMDAKELFMADRFHTDTGGVTMQHVPGRLAELAEAEAAVTQAAKLEAFWWVGRAFEQAVSRNEYAVVGPGGTQMYGQPRVLMMVVPNEPAPVAYVEACPVPVNAELWRDHQGPDLPNSPGESQSITSTISTPSDIQASGALAGHATETWDVHPLHLALSFKQAVVQADGALMV
jgi:hypothetical protein